jgi:hypothetical protein
MMIGKLRPEIEGILLGPYQAVYVEIPKVAASSLKTLFAQLLGLSLEEVGGDPHRVRFPMLLAERSGRSLFPGLFSFAFVRNPWDRLVSCYRDKILGEVDGFTHFTIRPGVANCLARFDAFVPDMSFEAFVAVVASIPDSEADDHFRSQYIFVTDLREEVGLDFVGRYEQLTDDFRLVRERVSLPPVELPWLQAARSRVDYREYYSAATRHVVAARFREDIEMFGYEFSTS